MTWYVDGRNPKTKKEFKEMVELYDYKSGAKEGEIPLEKAETILTARPVYVYQETIHAPEPPPPKGETKQVAVSGPKYPEPHRWYATVTIDHEFRVLKVK